MILVTGGAGYIGSHFIKTYLEQHPQAQVVVIDNLSEGHREALAFSDNIILYEANIGDVPTVQTILSKHPIKAVVHFAASAYVGESQENPQKYFENNVVNSIRLFQAMETAGVRKIVFSSTCASYGHPVYLPIDENHPQDPINVYGLTKLMVEKALKAHCERLGWTAIALRYFNAAGADAEGLLGESHEPETHLLPLVLRTAAGSQTAIKVFGTDYETPDGTCIRDYIHVTDLARAHCQALQWLEGQTGGFEFVNLGTTHGASVQEVIDLCRAVTGRKISVETMPRREGDPASLVAKAEKAYELLGWQATYTLWNVIESAWRWHQAPRY